MAEEDTDKTAQAAKIIRKHMLGSLASGILPLPIVDMAILTAIQTRMAGQLAKLHDVEFSEQRARAIIGSLAGLSLAVTAGNTLEMIQDIEALCRQRIQRTMHRAAGLQDDIAGAGAHGSTGDLVEDELPAVEPAGNAFARHHSFRSQALFEKPVGVHVGAIGEVPPHITRHTCTFSS